MFLFYFFISTLIKYDPNEPAETLVSKILFVFDFSSINDNADYTHAYTLTHQILCIYKIGCLS